MQQVNEIKNNNDDKNNYNVYNGQWISMWQLAENKRVRKRMSLN